MFISFSIRIIIFNYGRFKQSFIYDVIIYMKLLLDRINELHNKEKVEDNLFVKNIIVNKHKSKKNLPYIPTERWIYQLGDRLQINL